MAFQLTLHCWQLLASAWPTSWCGGCGAGSSLPDAGMSEDTWPSVSLVSGTLTRLVVCSSMATVLLHGRLLLPCQGHHASHRSHWCLSLTLTIMLWIPDPLLGLQYAARVVSLVQVYCYPFNYFLIIMNNQILPLLIISLLSCFNFKDPIVWPSFPVSGLFCV